jgi:hypothetical protein
LGPRGSRMPRHVDMQYAAPVMGEDDEEKQDPAGERGNREEIDRDGRASRGGC